MQEEPLDLPSFASEDCTNFEAASGARRARAKETVRLTRANVPTSADFATDAPLGGDLALADELLHLISQLEYGRAKLVGLPERAYPAAALQVAATMLGQTVRVAQRHLPGGAAAEALAEAEELAASVQNLQDRVAEPAFGWLGRLFAGSRPTTTKQVRKATRLLDRLPALLETFFVLFNGALSGAAAEEWTQTYKPFLGELDSVLDSLSH